MVCVCSYVEVHPVTGFVELQEFVGGHFYGCWVKGGEEFGGCEFAGVVN